MNTVTLYKDGDFIIVNAGSEREKDLMSLGWYSEDIMTSAAETGLDSMTIVELREYAKAHEIPIPASVTAKADIIELLKSKE